tara:strand:- start:626 stop:1102 length:477 start_codon:yes stop_codon:yes gene_type:complete
MNFNNIIIGITLLISLITLYTIYNVNNNMDKLLLDTDSDDLDGNTQRLSIVKYTKENNIKLNSLEGIVRQNPAGIKVIIDLLKEMMNFNDANFRAQNTTQMDMFRAQNTTQMDIKNDIDNLRRNFKFINERREEQAKVQHGLLVGIAKGLGVWGGAIQ